MKKVLLSMLVALMTVFLVSTETKATENTQEVVEKVSGLDKAKKILNDLKENGANLDAEGLKAKLMEFAAAIKPEMTKMFDLMKEVEKDPSKAAELTKELEDLEEVEKLIGELEKSVESIPAWKEVEFDEEFGKKFQEALGWSEDLHEEASSLNKAKEILNDLKENGANLDTEGLKAKLMEFAAAIKPEMIKMLDLMKEVEEDPSKAAELMKELEEDLEGVENLMLELEKLLESIPAWKEVEVDEEFGKKFQEALGMPEDL